MVPSSTMEIGSDGVAIITLQNPPVNALHPDGASATTSLAKLHAHLHGRGNEEAVRHGLLNLPGISGDIATLQCRCFAAKKMISWLGGNLSQDTLMNWCEFLTMIWLRGCLVSQKRIGRHRLWPLPISHPSTVPPSTIVMPDYTYRWSCKQIECASSGHIKMIVEKTAGSHTDADSGKLLMHSVDGVLPETARSSSQ